MARRALARDNVLGAMFFAALAWLFFDLGRPPQTPPGLPALLSAALFIDWMLKKDKQLGPRWICWLVVFGVIATGVFYAANTYAAYFYTRLMGILFLGFCLPLQGLLTSLRRVRWYVYTLIFIAFYVGVWAATHGGYGPAAEAGQDENYVAALMTMGAAFVYFTFLTDKRTWFRVTLALAMCAFIAAIALAQNPSRGGFLALISVAGYCLWRSPKKLMGLSIVGAAGAAMLLFAGETFWKEIDSTTDYESGTGDMRLELWKTGLRMWEANPLVGVGAGNFKWRSGDYQTARQLEKLGRNLGGTTIAHSSNIEMLSELGLVGTGAIIVLAWSTWSGLGKIRPPKSNRGQPPPHPDLVELGHYADALRCAMLAVFVNGTFLSLLYYSHLWVLIAAGTALPYVHRRIVARQALAAGAALPTPMATNAMPSPARSFSRRRAVLPRRQA